MKLTKIIIITLLMLISSLSFATITKPPPPPPTGSSTLDAINKFVYDTVNWQQGDPVPDTGSSTLNAIGQVILDVVNYGNTGTTHNTTGGGGAGGSFGDPTNPNSDPYSGNGGSIPDSGTVSYGCSTTVNGIVHTGTPEAICKPIMYQVARSYNVASFLYELRQVTTDKTRYSCFVHSESVFPPGHNFVIKCLSTCPTGQVYDQNTNSCRQQCPERSIYDSVSKICKPDPAQCLSPYTFINGVCVPPKQPNPVTKQCGLGYHLENDVCVKDPEKPCDPAIQECNPDGTHKCDFCAKLDTIIGNQNVQINQANTTNATLSQILAQQQVTNLKIDAINQRIEQLRLTNDTNAKINQQQLAEVITLLKQGVNLDIDPIIKAMNDNHADLTALIAKALIDSETEKPFLKIIIDKMDKQPQAIASAVTPVIAENTKKITDKQDEQTGILEEIRDLFKDDKENPTTPPEPQTAEEAQHSATNPFDSLKNYDIGQNRFGGGGGQCTADRQFQALGATFSLPMSNLCNILAMMGNLFVAIAYIAGGIIVVKGAGGN